MSSTGPVGHASIDITETESMITLSDEIDASLIALLHEVCATAERHAMPVTIDCAGVSFMDSSGVAFIARLASRLPEKVAITGATSSLRFILDVTGLTERVRLE